jgi:hypothetical protein
MTDAIDDPMPQIADYYNQGREQERLSTNRLENTYER